MSAAYDAYDASNNHRNCSGHPDFCFFCQFGPQSSSGDVDMSGELRSIVHSMASNHCEVSQIAKRVHTAYEADVRQSIVYEKDDGEIEEQPEWSIASITRHLLHSSEFSLFGNLLDSAFQNILMTLQQQIFDEENECDPERLDQFLKTAKTYTSYQVSTRREGAGRKKPRTH